MKYNDMNYDELLKKLREYANDCPAGENDTQDFCDNYCEYNSKRGDCLLGLIEAAADKIEQENRLICKLVNNKPKGWSREAEREIVNDGIEAMRRCVKNHDMDTLLVIARMCKVIAGDRFSIEVEKDGERDERTD